MNIAGQPGLKTRGEESRGERRTLCSDGDPVDHGSKEHHQRQRGSFLLFRSRRDSRRLLVVVSEGSFPRGGGKFRWRWRKDWEGELGSESIDDDELSWWVSEERDVVSKMSGK